MRHSAILTFLTGILLINTIFCPAQSPSENSDRFVIILDIQEHFTQNVLADSTADRLISNINHFIVDVDSKNVIYIQSILRTLSVSLKGFNVDTIPNLELDSRLTIKNNNIIKKSKANAFEVIGLNEYLEKNNAKEIIVIGLMAEHCVYETLVGGKEKGYEMYVIPEAIAAKSEKSKEKIIKKLTKNGIHVMHIKGNPLKITFY